MPKKTDLQGKPDKAFEAELARLDLDQHLSSQRSNGLRAMVARIRALAEATRVRA